MKALLYFRKNLDENINYSKHGQTGYLCFKGGLLLKLYLEFILLLNAQSKRTSKKEKLIMRIIL